MRVRVWSCGNGFTETPPVLRPRPVWRERRRQNRDHPPQHAVLPELPRVQRDVADAAADVAVTRSIAGGGPRGGIGAQRGGNHWPQLEEFKAVPECRLCRLWVTAMV